MTGERNSLTWTQSDTMAEAALEKSCHAVLEMSPPDYMAKISRFLESSVEPSKQDPLSNEPAGAESDSGESLFITQKPVPEAARPRRRRRCTLRSDPTSPRDLQESESDSSSSASQAESRTDKERRRTKYTLHRYSFPFLSGRRQKPESTLLHVKQNTSLHNSAMGGFFKCVRELWGGDQRGDDVESSPPTLDMDGDCISPLSEEEEERSQDEDIKVVERRCLVAPSRARRQQSWCKQLKQEKRKEAGNARQETSQGKQCKTLHKIPATASILRATPLCLDTESAEDGESSCGGLVERERINEPVTSDENLLAQMETPKTKRHLSRENKKILFQQKAKEEEPCNDSDATVFEPQTLQRSPSKYTQKAREASTPAAAEPHTEVLHIDDLSKTGQTEDKPESQNLFHSLPVLFSDPDNDSTCNETKVKKRTHDSVEEENRQSQVEPDDLHHVKTVEVEETPSLSGDNRAEPLASQTSDELEFNERNRGANSSHVDPIVRPQVDKHLESDVTMEDSVCSVSCKVETGGKKKKKRIRSDEDVEQLQSSTAGAETQMKKKKRKKEETIVDAEEREEEEASGNGVENTATSEETQSSYVKRKKHKKKQQFSNHAAQGGEEGGEVSFSNDALTLDESTVVLLKKKKKKKAFFEGLDDSHTLEESKKDEDEHNTQQTKDGLEDQTAELVTKKKKKKNKMRSGRNISEDSVAQSDDSVSVRKKEKKRTSSFLVADAEENDAQTHSEQKSPSHSVDARVRGAEKSAVSAGDLETESAEITGKLEESSDGVRKKKRKRKRKTSAQQDSTEKDHEQDFEEMDKTCQSALSQLLTPMEKVESAADVGNSATEEDVASKKKKKKKREEETCRVMLDPQSAAEYTESEKSSLNTCSSVSRKKKGKHLTFSSDAKGKHGHSADVSHDGTSDQDNKETLNVAEQASQSPQTPGNQALNDIRDKRKKMKSPGKILLEGKMSSKSAELEPRENKKKQRSKQSAVISSSPVLSQTSLSSKMSSSDRVMKNKHLIVKRTLYNPSGDFFTDD